MLFRQTLFYLPAQLLPPLFQFVQLIAWSHLSSSGVIGIVTLFVSVQEMLNIGFMTFWSSYTTRFSAAMSTTLDDQTRLANVSTAIVAASLAIQIVLALVIYSLFMRQPLPPSMIAIIAALVGGRALNLFQAERARAKQDIVGYSVAVMAGPVFGMLFGLLFLVQWHAVARSVFAGFALAQVAGAGFSLLRDPHWLRLGRPDMAIMRHAVVYGGPLLISSVTAWVSQNIARIILGYHSSYAAVGVYSLGFGMGYRASIIAAMLVTAAAFPIAVRLANAGDIDGGIRQLRENGALLCAILFPASVGLACVAGDMVHILVSRRIEGPVVPVMEYTLLAGTMICLRQYFFNQVFLLRGTTRWIARIAVAEMVLAVIAATFGVLHAGAVGGAQALALTSFVSMAVSGAKAHEAGLVVPWNEASRLGIAAGLMGAMLLLMPPSAGALHLAAKIAGAAAIYLILCAILMRRKIIDMLRSRRHLNLDAA